MRQKNDLRYSFRHLSVLFFHLLLSHYCSGQSQLIAPSQPIVATVGDDIILPCHLKPEADVVAMTLEWTRPDLNDIFVHVRRSGQELLRSKHPSYKGRTSVSIDELQHGNVSLKLSKLNPSDAGRYKCYIPKLNTGSVIELIVGAASSLVISLSEINRNKGAVVLQCESTGWYPEPEVFWLDGEGNLLSAGPTETVRGPDDLYTVSSRVTVEKRHSNSFTCRVQQNSTNQIRETHIHVPDDFFELQSSSSSTTVGLAVSLAVCILVILILGFFVWRQNIFKRQANKRSHRDEPDTGVKPNLPKPEDQAVTVEEPESQQLLTHETVPMKDRNKGQAAGIRPEEEKLRRREAEKLLELLKEELENKMTEIRKKQSDLQQLEEEKKKKEENVKRLKEHLENKNTEVKTIEAELVKHSRFTSLLPLNYKKEQKKKEVENLKRQLETEEPELATKTKQIDDKQAEVKKLQKEIQQMETNLKPLMEKLESNNEKAKEIQSAVVKHRLSLSSKKEKKKKEDAEKELENLKKQLETEEKELDTKTKQMKEHPDETIRKLQQETQDEEEAQSEVMMLNDQLESKNKEKQNSSSFSQNSTRKPAVVFKVDSKGRYIQLRNTSTQDQQLGGWVLKIQVNNEEPIKHTFEEPFNLKTGKVLTVCCCSHDKTDPPTDLVLEDLKLWSNSNKPQVSLISHPGEIQYNLDCVY